MAHETSGAVKLFVNSRQVATGASSLPNTVTRTINYIGRSVWSSDSYFDGSLDELYLFGRALSDSEVTDFMETGCGLRYEV